MWFEEMPMHFKDAPASIRKAIRIKIETKYRGLLYRYSNSIELYAHIFCILAKKEYRRMRRLGKRVKMRTKQIKPIYYGNSPPI